MNHSGVTNPDSPTELASIMQIGPTLRIPQGCAKLFYILINHRKGKIAGNNDDMLNYCLSDKIQNHE
jgi:hypothetical protein